jgi:hypothetical protein
MDGIDKHAEEARCKRVTGKSLQDWDEERNNLLMADVATGRLNPARWMPAFKLSAMARRYGLMEDGVIEWGTVSWDELKTWNRDLPRIRFDRSGKVVKSDQAFRLCPKACEDLYRLYGTAK